MLAIRLSEDIEKRLEKLAKRTGRTKSFYARQAILEYIEDLEDIYLAEKSMKNPGRLWTLEELEQNADLDR